MKTVGISAAGGVGQGTAQTIVNGYSQYDMYELDMSRFLGLHNNRRFLRDRVKEVPGMLLYFCIKIIPKNTTFLKAKIYNSKGGVYLSLD